MSNAYNPLYILCVFLDGEVASRKAAELCEKKYGTRFDSPHPSFLVVPGPQEARTLHYAATEFIP
jgi:hypothetical protein